jgi:K+-transporting ATPase ATPase C chain
MLAQIRRSIVLALVAVVLFGFVYALVGTGLAQLFFQGQADGSVTKNGSTLIGQSWNSYSATSIENPQWFHGRPDPDNPLEANSGKKGSMASGNSGASNLGPRSKALVQQTQALVKAWHNVGVNPTTDLVTTSGSGIDPDITPQDAYVQVPMVSQATGISASRLNQLIASQTQGAELGFLGSSYVNVLQLNEALAQLQGQ